MYQSIRLTHHALNLGKLCQLFLHDSLDVQGFQTEVFEQAIFYLQLGLEFLVKNIRVCHIHQANAVVADLIRIDRPNAPTRGARAGSPLGHLVDGFHHGMVGHHHMAARGDPQTVGQVDSSCLDCSNLTNQRSQVEHHPRADDADGFGVRKAIGGQTELERPILINHSVASVITAVKPGYDTCILRKQIDNFAFGFISPLSSKNHANAHAVILQSIPLF